jgi:hypothetical protein
MAQRLIFRQRTKQATITDQQGFKRATRWFSLKTPGLAVFLDNQF